jgi:hypothetical protein
MASALASLQAGLDRIAEAVRHAAGDSKVMHALRPVFDEETMGEPVDGGVVPPSTEVGKTLVASPESPISMPGAGVSGASLLAALRDLQQVRSRSLQPVRDVLESVIQDAEHRSGELTPAGVRDILVQLDRVDEAFLEDVRTRVPLMRQTLNKLRQEDTKDFVTASQLQPIVEQVEVLHDVADRVQAGMITMILQGLRSFLLAAAYRKADNLTQRLEAFEGRIQALIPMAEQWVTIGRVERAAIADILPE